MPTLTMLLNFSDRGSGPPAIIIHGLFGSFSNLGMLATALLDGGLRTISVDARNHGQSPHADAMDYPTMAKDIVDLLDHLQLPSAHILGHSMGGKIAMQMALSHPDRVNKLLVADIAPTAYSRHHDEILQGLRRLAETPPGSRQQADEMMKPFAPNMMVRSFLLKNLYLADDSLYRLRINLDAIVKHYDDIVGAVMGTPFNGETLFIAGAKDHYVQPQHMAEIERLFPHSRLEYLQAGHWLHAEKPKQFNQLVLDFLT